MKKVKKLMALLLSMIMVFAMSVTAFAANTTNGNLTVNLQNGSLKNQRIYLFKLFDYKSVNPAKYTVNDKYKTQLQTVLKTSSTESYDLYSAIVALGKDNSESVQNFANDFTKEVIKDGSIVGTQETDYKIADVIAEGTSYVFENVTPGYYLVYLGGSVSIQSSLVTVNGNTSVNLKSTTPIPDKKGDKPSVNIGDVITYTVDFTIPDITGYMQDTYVFTLKDTLSDGLDFVKSAADKTVVTAGNLEVSVKIDNNNAMNMNATVTGRTLTLDLKQTVIENQEPKGQKVTVTYYAQVNENAETGGTSNSAKLEYTNNPTTGETGESTPDVVETPTFDIKVHKYEQGKDTEYLANATFQLHKEKPNGTVIKMVDESTNGKYTVAKDQEKATVTELKTAAEQIGGTGANLQIYGLAEGTYYLVETNAPEGFTDLYGVVKIVITKDETPAGYSITAQVEDPEGMGTGIMPTPLDTKGNVISIENKRGTVLPGTGGMGTVIFTVAGILLILGVGASFVISRKRKTE